MTINLLTQITIYTACITILIGVLNSYKRTQKALRWWYCRQAIKLSSEAEQIRNSLLQESFIIRRNLEILTADNLDLSTSKAQDCLIQIDSLHKSLTQLSDRLFPIYLQYNFPCAIQCLLESWLISHPDLRCYTDIPSLWRHESIESSLIVFTTVDELLKISLSEVSTQTSIYISLKEYCSTARLIVKIIYRDRFTCFAGVNNTFLSDSKIVELQHLCHSFESLTSGKCYFESNNLNYCWSFQW